MRKLVIGVIVAGAVSTVAGYLWITDVASKFMMTNQRTSKEMADRIEIQCPSGTSTISRPWGKSGWSVLCGREGVPHGPWFAVEAGRLKIRGAYQHGSRCGPWEWLSLDGSVMKREIFSTCSVSGMARPPSPQAPGSPRATASR